MANNSGGVSNSDLVVRVFSGKVLLLLRLRYRILRRLHSAVGAVAVCSNRSVHDV